MVEREEGRREGGREKRGRVGGELGRKGEMEVEQKREREG